MKKFLAFFIFAIAAAGYTAQSSFTPPLTIPPYHLLTTDSVNITPANLKKNVPLVIIYFQPDCSHCQHMMFDLKPKMEQLKHVQVVMVTFVQLKAIQVFYRDFDLKKYPNFTVGTEGYSLQLQKFYQIKTTPYIAIYDKNGKLFKVFDKAPKTEELIETIKKV